MKTIFKIARTELRSLFYSPIAWFLMIVFLIQCALAYTGQLESAAKTQEMGGRGLEYMRDLTERIFTGRGGVFQSVMQNLYLFIPLLTMGLISREINGGTIRLLYSSPVKVRQIVFGKYLAMMVYSLLLVAIVAIFLVAGIFNIRNAESAMLWSSTLGFFLLLCAYSAIGLFMSCLTTYQVVAAVATFIMIGILSYIGNLWQEIDFVRDLTYFLSLQGRTQHMLVGLVTTKDILYFVIIVYIFLGLSIFKLKAGRESKPAMVKAGRYAFIIVSALLAGYITSRPALTGYWDVTANKKRTLTPKVQEIIRQFGDDKLEITVYNNLLDNHVYYGLPTMRNNYLSFWETYTRFKPDIGFKYVNYYDSSMGESRYMMEQYKKSSLSETADKTAKNYNLKLSSFLPPAEIRKQIDLRPESNRFVMQLRYKDRTTFLRIFDDMAVFPGETEVSAAFKRLQLAKLPHIAFLTGQLERNINKIGEREYRALTNLKTFRYSLLNQGFDIDTVSLGTQDVPGIVSTLVIADPKTEFSPDVQARIRSYVDKGGNLLVVGEPGKQSLLSPILRPLGVQLMEGTIAQPSAELSPDLVQTYMTAAAASFSKAASLKRDDSVVVAMPGATGISYSNDSGFTVKPLLMTDGQKSWMKRDKLVTDSAAITFSAANGDQKGTMATAIAMTRQINGKEQRIVVTGDADFMSNNELQRSTIQTANYFFNSAIFSWLSNGEFPIDASRPESKDKRVNVTPDQADMLKIAFVWVFPGLLLIFATILLIRRKRK